MQFSYDFVCQAEESHRGVGRGLGYRLAENLSVCLRAECSLGAVTLATFGNAPVSKEILGTGLFRSFCKPHTHIVFLCMYIHAPTTESISMLFFMHTSKACVHQTIRSRACALDKRRKHIHTCVCVCMPVYMCISVSLSLPLEFFPSSSPVFFMACLG